MKIMVSQDSKQKSIPNKWMKTSITAGKTEWWLERKHWIWQLASHWWHFLSRHKQVLKAKHRSQQIKKWVGSNKIEMNFQDINKKKKLSCLRKGLKGKTEWKMLSFKMEVIKVYLKVKEKFSPDGKTEYLGRGRKYWLRKIQNRQEGFWLITSHSKIYLEFIYIFSSP